MPTYEELAPGVDPTTRVNPVPRTNFVSWMIAGLLIIIGGLTTCWLAGGSKLLMPDKPQLTTTGSVTASLTAPYPTASPSATAPALQSLPVMRQATPAPTWTMQPIPTSIVVTRIVYVNHDRVMTVVMPITQIATFEVTRIYLTHVPVITYIIVTATPSSTPTSTPTLTPTETATATSTETATTIATATATATATETATEESSE